MIAAFNHNDDIHRITAAQVFHVPEDMVTPLMRSRAKAVNFGIVYGIGAHSLSQDIGVSYSEAKTYIDEYLAHYSHVAAFMDRLIAEAKEKGYALTLFGRRRPLPELRASNGVTRAFGERVARNMPIQGTAADIIKRAMIRVYRRLQEEGLQAPSDSSGARRANCGSAPERSGSSFHAAERRDGGRSGTFREAQR